MLTCVDVKFIFDSVRFRFVLLRKYSQNSRCRLAVFAMFLLLFCLVPAVVLTVETSEMSAIFFHNQNNPTSSQGLFGNGALTCSGLHF